MSNVLQYGMMMSPYTLTSLVSNFTLRSCGNGLYLDYVLNGSGSSSVPRLQPASGSASQLWCEPFFVVSVTQATPLG